MSPFVSETNPAPDDPGKFNFDESPKNIQDLSDFRNCHTFQSIRNSEVDWDSLTEQIPYYDQNSAGIDQVKLGLTDILESAKKLILKKMEIPKDLILIEKVNQLLSKLNEICLDTKTLSLTMSVSEMLYAIKSETAVINPTTLFGTEIEDIPSNQFFISESGHGFDTSDLKMMMDSKSKLFNVYTRASFTDMDLQKLENFTPIKTHAVFKAIAHPETKIEARKVLVSLIKQVSHETKEKLQQVYYVFAQSSGSGRSIHLSEIPALEEKARVLVDLKEYLANLEPAEREALEQIAKEHSFVIPLSQAIDDLLQGSCNNEYTQYFGCLINHLNTY